MADSHCQEEEEQHQKPVSLEVSRDGREPSFTQESKRLKHQGQQYQYQPGRQGNRNRVGSSSWLQTDQKIGNNRDTSFASNRQQATMSRGYSQKPLVTRRMLENPWAELEQRCSF